MRNKQSTHCILAQTDRLLKLEKDIQAMRIQHKELFTRINNLKKENSEKVELIKSLSIDKVNLTHKIEDLNSKIKDDEVRLIRYEFKDH